MKSPLELLKQLDEKYPDRDMSGFAEAQNQLDIFMKKLIFEAQDAFWAVVAREFPEITTGDFSPDATLAFDDACEKAVLIWIQSNMKE